MNKIKATAVSLAFIALTLTACEEKQAAKPPTEPPAEAATQQPTQEVTAVAEKTAETETSAGETKIVCGKGGGSVKLPCITDGNGDVQRFEYDEQNRIVKIGDKTITYADNLITVGTQKFVINGSTITVDNKSFTIDKDGYIVKNIVKDGETTDEYKYEYKDGNLMKSTLTGVYIDVYSYDDKKSPFSNCKSPKWLLQHIFGELSGSKNNILVRNTEGEVSSMETYEYEYDSEGFPTKDTGIAYVEGNEEKSTTNYKYYGSK